MSGYAALAADVVGSGLNIWAQIYGIQEQRKENRRAERINKEMFERGIELEADERREERLFKREESNASQAYQHRMSFLDNMLTNLNRNSTASANLQKLLRGRR